MSASNPLPPGDGQQAGAVCAGTAGCASGERVNEQVEVAVLRRLAALSAQINRGERLDDTLQAVVDGVVEALGFGAAALNYLRADGNLQVLAVAGPPELHETLAGVVVDRAAMDGLLARSEAWGALRFASHDHLAVDETCDWVPDVDVPHGPDAWHPQDALLAPLHGRDGALVGVLSVDLPPGQRRPSQVLRELLEMFAVQAGVAIGNTRLIDQLRLEHARLQASDTAFRFAFTASAGAMATLNLDLGALGQFIEVNDAFVAAVGYSAAELARSRWPQLLAPGERVAGHARLGDLAAGMRRHQRSEQRITRGDGTTFWAAVTTTVIAPDHDQPAFLLVHFEDITERKNREEILARQADLDPLTGLPNRRMLHRHLHTVLTDAALHATTGTVIYADLDHFKAVNDRYGHATGDLVLQQTAARLRAQIRVDDVIARIGGDEFVIVAVDLPPEATTALIRRIHAAFSQPMTATNHTVTITIGTATFDGTTISVDSVLHQADMAMYTNKGAHPPTTGT